MTFLRERARKGLYEMIFAMTNEFKKMNMMRMMRIVKNLEFSGNVRI